MKKLCQQGKQIFMQPKCNPYLHLAFDVGHSSIGWAVLQTAPAKEPKVDCSVELLGCGTVTFQTEDCLASVRRNYRRQRRHIRSTRQRVARMKLLFAHLAVLTKEQLDLPGRASPWLLAARVLRGGQKLAWDELWDVLRWYAHNRGYDGNKAWSKHDAASNEDSDKERRASELLIQFERKYGRPGTMAEVFCDVLKIDPLGAVQSSVQRVRNLGAAFPREGVEDEVERILRAHIGVLNTLDDRVVSALMRDYTALRCPGLRLPGRYGQRLHDGSLSPGGLLFGQLVPRFNNRIIARCPITFERVYESVKAETGDEDKAKHEAEKLSKVPSVNCIDFRRFRWAMQLANVQIATVDARKVRLLTVAERCAVNEEMEKHGFLSPGDFKKAVRALTNKAPDNLDRMLALPDADRALVVHPVRRYVHTHALVSVLWPLLTERLRKRLAGQWRRGNTTTIAELINACAEERPSVEALCDKYLDSLNTKRRKKGETMHRGEFMRMPLWVQPSQGRAPHTREVMRKVNEFVFATDRHPADETGPLFRSESVRQAQLQRALDEQTNNHLVRQRLKLLERLHSDLLKTYARDDRSCIARVTIEVNRDVSELSGKTAPQQAQLQRQQLAQFKGVAKKLAEAYEGLGVHVGPGLIRKGRIAEDLDWTCPYTGKSYDALDLLYRRVDKDHIIPRSSRASDSLDSLVITFSEVNKMKGQRTAVRFLEEFQTQPVQGLAQVMLKPLSIYLKDVDALETFKGHDDDQRRKKNRKRLLSLRDYIEKEFVPRDLTQTSQLVRLGAQALQKHYIGAHQLPVITSLPGSVTGAVRKSWNLLGCLATANPLVLNPDDRDENGRAKVRTKTEIRGVTHLHHALDACVLAFASFFLPRDGGAWELLVKRRLNMEEQCRARRLFGSYIEITKDGELRLADLSPVLKTQICERLKERRVVQHLPSDVSGLLCKETVWRIFDSADPHPNSRRLARWLAQKKVPVPASDAKTALIICRKRRNTEVGGGEVAGGKVFRETKTWRWIYDIKDKSALLGLSPQGDVATAKLRRIKAVKVLGDNFGLALDPKPILIRPHMIWHQLDELRRANEGKPIRVVRKGTLIRVTRAKSVKVDYRGVWMVRGTTLNQRAGFLVDLSPVDQITYRRQPGCRENVSVATLLNCGLEVLKVPLCGVTSII